MNTNAMAAAGGERSGDDRIAAMEQDLAEIRNEIRQGFPTLRAENDRLTAENDALRANLRALAATVIASTAALSLAATKAERGSLSEPVPAVDQCGGCGATSIAADDPYHQAGATGSYPCCVGARAELPGPPFAVGDRVVHFDHGGGEVIARFDDQPGAVGVRFDDQVERGVLVADLEVEQ